MAMAGTYGLCRAAKFDDPFRRGATMPIRWQYLAMVAACISAVATLAEEPRAGLDYFEREVRPILVDTCQKCHGEKKQEGELRLDSRAALLKGGSIGPAIEPGNPEKSLLIAAVRHVGDVQMPPKAKL